MHPILTRPERLALYLGAWVVVGTLIAGVLNRQGLTFAEALVLVLPLFLAYSSVCRPGTSAARSRSDRAACGKCSSRASCRRASPAASGSRSPTRGLPSST